MHRLHNYPAVQGHVPSPADCDSGRYSGGAGRCVISLVDGDPGTALSTIIAGVWLMPPRDYPAGDVCPRRRRAD